MSTPTRTEIIYAASLEYNLRCALGVCFTCASYLARSRARILDKLIDKAVAEKRDGDEVVTEFVLAVHERHKAGEALS